MTHYVSALVVLLVLIGAYYAWRFVLSYRHDDWRRYEAGRHIMAFTLGIAIILTWSVFGLTLRAVWPEEAWVLSVLGVGRILIFGWAALMMRSRYRMLVAAHAALERSPDHGPTQ